MMGRSRAISCIEPGCVERSQGEVEGLQSSSRPSGKSSNGDSSTLSSLAPPHQVLSDPGTAWSIDDTSGRLRSASPPPKQVARSARNEHEHERDRQRERRSGSGGDEMKAGGRGSVGDNGAGRVGCSTDNGESTGGKENTVASGRRESHRSSYRRHRHRARNDWWRMYFDLPATESLRAEYMCALYKKILLQGKMFVFDSYVCFHANVFGYVKKKVIDMRDVSVVRKATTVVLFNNAVEVIHSGGKREFFTSFLSRDHAYKLIMKNWAGVSEYAQDFIEQERLQREEKKKLSNSSSVSASLASTTPTTNRSSDTTPTSPTPVLAASTTTSNTTISTSPSSSTRAILRREQDKLAGEKRAVAERCATSPVIVPRRYSRSYVQDRTEGVADDVFDVKSASPSNGRDAGYRAASDDANGQNGRNTGAISRWKGRSASCKVDARRPVRHAPSRSVGSLEDWRQAEDGAVPGPDELRGSLPSVCTDRSESRLRHALPRGLFAPGVGGSRGAGDPTFDPFSPPSQNKVIITETFPCSVHEFFSLFWSDASAFPSKYHTSVRGDSLLQLGTWTRHDIFGYARDVSFRSPVKGVTFGPRETRCLRTEKCSGYAGMGLRYVVIEGSQTMSDIPYGDSFSVDTRWDIVGKMDPDDMDDTAGRGASDGNETEVNEENATPRTRRRIKSRRSRRLLELRSDDEGQDEDHEVDFDDDEDGFAVHAEHCETEEGHTCGRGGIHFHLSRVELPDDELLPRGTHCQVTLSVAVPFKRYTVLKPAINRATMDETGQSYRQWFDLAREELRRARRNDQAVAGMEAAAAVTAAAKEKEREDREKERRAEEEERAAMAVASMPSSKEGFYGRLRSFLSRVTAGSTRAIVEKTDSTVLMSPHNGSLTPASSTHSPSDVKETTNHLLPNGTHCKKANGNGDIYGTHFGGDAVDASSTAGAFSTGQGWESGRASLSSTTTTMLTVPMGIAIALLTLIIVLIIFMASLLVAMSASLRHSELLLAEVRGFRVEMQDVLAHVDSSRS